MGGAAEGLLQQAIQNDPRRTCQGEWVGLGKGCDPRRTCQDKWEGLQKGCYNEHHGMNLGTPARVSGRGWGGAVTINNTKLGVGLGEGAWEETA